MATRAQLTTSGELEITGTINSRIPPITDGLLAHYPFDGTTSASYRDFSTLKVLGYRSNASYPWYNWFSTNTNLTETLDLTTEVNATVVSNYDLVVVDSYAWGVDTSIMSKIKELVDAGISVLATGNDTRTNVFVKTYTATAHTAHDISTIYGETYTGIGSGDLYGGIDVLENGVQELYRRTDSNQITGYTYQSPISGAVLYFDQDGSLSFTNEAAMDGLLFAIENSKGRQTKINNEFGFNGLIINEPTTNLLDTHLIDTEHTKPGPYDILEGWEILGTGSDTRKTLDSSNISVTSSGVYTFSAMYWGDSGVIDDLYLRFDGTGYPEGDVYIQPFRNDHTSSLDGFSKIYKIEENWYYCYGTFRITADTSNITSIFFDSDVLDQTIFISNLQLEQQTTPTNFVETERSSKNELTLDIDGRTEITIFGKFMPYSPWKDADGFSYTRSQSMLIKISDSVNVANAIFRYWHNGSISAPFLDPSGYYGTSHIHKYYEIDSIIPIYFALRKSGTTIKIKLYQSGSWKDEHILTGVPLDSIVDSISLGSNTPLWNGKYNNVSIYNRELTNLELDELVNDSFRLQTDGSLHNNISTNDLPGWTKVYEGLCVSLFREYRHDGEIFDYYGEDVLFDEMMVRAVYWDYEKTATTTETAKLKNSIKWYAEWLDLQPDTPDPQILFHGTDDVQDVAFTSIDQLFWGYGNSWRRIATPLYVDGTSMYLGATPTTIINEDWEAIHGGNPNYAGYMANNYPKESGTWKLTPRQYQTIQIYVRLQSTKESRMEVLEGIVNPSTIHTKEVL